MSGPGAVTPYRRRMLAALVAAFGLRVAAGCVLNVDASGVHRGFDFYGFMADHVLDGRGLVWRSTTTSATSGRTARRCTRSSSRR
jgi:hypothetical protein